MKNTIIYGIKKFPSQNYYVNIGKLDGMWVAILEIEDEGNSLYRIELGKNAMLYKLLAEIEPVVKEVEDELNLTLDIVTISTI